MSDIYIDPPIETSPDELAEDAFDQVQEAIPGWVPNDGNLETIILEAVAQMAAELRDVASAVPRSIFRYFGRSLVGVNPTDATPATALTTWTMINNAGYTIPAGTVVAVPVAGDVLVEFVVDADYVINPGSTSRADVRVVALTPGEESSGLGSVGLALELIDTLDFVQSVTLNAITTGGVDAETDDEYLDRLVRQLRLLSAAPILPEEFAAIAADEPGVDRALALDGYNPAYNALTANQASAETDASGWVSHTNAVLASTSAQAADGSKSVSMTASSTGDTLARTPGPVFGAGAIPVVPGETWTAIASVRAATTARQFRVHLYITDSAGVFVTTIAPAYILESTSAWTQLVVSGTIPAGGAFASLIVEILAVPAGEIHYIDKASMHRGTSSSWSAGGTAETGNERMVAVALVDESGEPVAPSIKNAVDAKLQSLREINFVVSVMDPVYGTVDVSVVVNALSGFDLAQVQSDVSAALTAYFQPGSWGRAEITGDIVRTTDWAAVSTVRYNELITLVSNVTGVDYVESLQLKFAGGSFGTSDLTLPGPAGLTRPGTMSVTVNP